MSYHNDEKWSKTNHQSKFSTKTISMTRAHLRARTKFRRNTFFSRNIVFFAESMINSFNKYQIGTLGILLSLPPENSPIVIEDALTRSGVHI